MGCCGKARTLKHIGVGHIKVALGIPDRWSAERLRICEDCDEKTYLSGAEYRAWLAGYPIEIIEFLDELEKLPPLPKYANDDSRRLLCCSICKCPVLQKAAVKREVCPLAKWPIKGD